MQMFSIIKWLKFDIKHQIVAKVGQNVTREVGWFN